MSCQSYVDYLSILSTFILFSRHLFPFFTAASSGIEAAPEVYTVPPPQPKERKVGQLSPQQVEQFFEEGYVVVPKLFSKEELHPVIEGINESVDIIAEKLFNAGKIKDKAENAGFYQRLIRLEDQFKGAAVLLLKQGCLPTSFRNLWSNERLLNIVEQFIGPEIAGHPVWNLRTKTPANEQTTVPWHQDNAYLDKDALYVLQPTAWIPLIDANVINGCMQVIRGGHKLGRTATHTCCAGGTWYVDLAEEEIIRTFGADMEKDVVTCEVPMGGVLFINNCIPHRSLENYSDKVRWSLDLRWQRPDRPNGFHGLKDSVLMHTVKDPNYVIQWEEFATLDRSLLQEAAMKVESDPFDTSIHGPWMNRWEITHHNKHTKSLLTGGSSWHSHVKA